MICPKCFAHMGDTTTTCPTCGAEVDLTGQPVQAKAGAPGQAAPPTVHPHHHMPAPNIAPAIELTTGGTGRRVMVGFFILVVVAAAAFGVIKWRRTAQPAVAAWVSPPRAVPGLPAGGLAHSCVVTESGLALCWGERSFGQLGDTVGAMTGVPCAVCSNAKFTQLDAGDNHTCGLTDRGEVMCWGANFRGQLGAATTTDCVTARGRYPCAVTPLQVPIADVAMVTAGAEHTCALLSDSTVTCWGGGYRGQLGVMSLAPRQTMASVARRYRFTTISAGEYHTCGIAPDGAVLCWGWNVHGQIGAITRQQCGPTMQSRSACGAEPTRIASDLRFSAVAAGFAHSCAISSEGRAYCWGVNDSGQLGTGTTDSSMIPMAVSGDHRFVAIAAGSRFSCALDGDGALWCWGSNSHGQLGQADQGPTDLPFRATPMRVGLTLRALSLGAGAEHACAVVEGPRAFCWGSGGEGQLGNGRTADARTPVEAGLDTGN